MKRAVGLAVVLLLVLGGAFLGDGLFRDYVEQRVAAAIASQLGTGSTPTVSLGGTPFSLALITRAVPNAHATVDAVPLEIAGHQVELADVAASTGEIRLEGDTVTVATLTATGTLTYSDLAKVAELPVSYAGDGRLELRYTTAIFGRELSFAISAVPNLDVPQQVIRLTDPQLDLAGSTLDVPLTQAQLDAIVQPIDVGMDYGLRLTGADPAAEGVKVRIEADEVTAPVR